MQLDQIIQALKPTYESVSEADFANFCRYVKMECAREEAEFVDAFEPFPLDKTYQVKQKVIEWITQNKPCPNKTLLRVNYAGLTVEEMERFKLNYRQHGCITLEVAQLYTMEKAAIIDMFM